MITSVNAKQEHRTKVVENHRLQKIEALEDLVREKGREESAPQKRDVPE